MSDATPAPRKFLGQPGGLANLFGIELWERFSFYGMQSLLAFYLYYSATEGGLGMNEATALSIVGAYGGFVYMTTLVASLVADRLLGSERTLFYSAILVMLGHVLLAVIPGFLGLALGLVFVGLGSGGVKTCAQVVLGDLYSKEDTRRDAGFALFYLAVNIGSFFGPLVTNFLGFRYNFHIGFGAAAVGMAIGLIQYALMRKSTIGEHGREVPNPLPRSRYLPWALAAVAITVVAVVLITTGIVPLASLSTVIALIALVMVIVLLWQMFSSPLTSPKEKSRLIGYIPMLLVSVGFFAIFQSQFTVLAVYADQRLDRNFLFWELDPGQVTSFNPVFIILFSTLFALMWSKLGPKQPSSPVKFGIGAITIGVSLFFFLPYATSGENGTPIWVVIWILFLFTMGELMVSPVGNSLATKVAPEAFSSRTMAMWLLTLSMGTALSGSLGSLYDPSDPSAERTFFTIVGIAAIVLGIAIIAIKGWVLRKFVDVR